MRTLFSRVFRRATLCHVNERGRKGIACSSPQQVGAGRVNSFASAGKDGHWQILYLRSTGAMSEQIWNPNSVETVATTIVESFGVEERSHFYEPGVGSILIAIVARRATVYPATSP